MKKNLMILLLSGMTFQSIGQNDKSWIAIETDPMTTAFGARTLSVILEPKKTAHWSLFLNVVSADFPSWMDDILNPKNKGKSFESKIKIGGGFAMDYFLKSERKGYYLGLVNLFFGNQINGAGGTSEGILIHNIIPRVGYRWYPFQKARFYVNPFMGFRYEHMFGKKSSIDGEEFKAAGFGPFGTVHIGYHF